MEWCLNKIADSKYRAFNHRKQPKISFKKANREAAPKEHV